MKLQNFTVIFIIIILPIVLVLSAYIGYEIQTIHKQNMYNTGIVSATHDAIFAFEMNTKNDPYSNNTEKKRSNIKASVKAFENSLSTTCNLGLYNNNAIEEYIPAIVFGLYDGFYMYAPYENQKEEYKHNLRNYVYYAEKIQGDIIIRYTLDNYVAVSGTINGKYTTKAGYLANLSDYSGFTKTSDGKVPNGATIKYKGLEIIPENLTEYIDKNHKNKIDADKSAYQYYKSAYEFTNWFLNTAKIGDLKSYLNINNSNDPENENSAFSVHKKEIIKNKIEETLNSSITAYANKTRINYKMPKFTDEDWEKVYSNISVISLVQGMNLGFKNYNNYCILNSTNSSEFVNANLIYFTDGNDYHDIRCPKIKNKSTTGYRIGSFEKVTYETTDNVTEEVTKGYYYKHNELACYKCINSSVNNNESIYNYVRASSTDNKVKQSYFLALGRERYKTTKLLDAAFNAEYVERFNVNYIPGEVANAENIPPKQRVKAGTTINIPTDVPTDPSGEKTFLYWTERTDGGTYYPSTNIANSTYTVEKDTVFEAVWANNNIIQYYSDSSLIRNDTKEYNIPYTINCFVTKNGYDFAGWKVRGKSQIYQNGSTYTGNEDLVLDAQWTKNRFTIKYTTNSGQFVEYNVNYGENHEVKGDLFGHAYAGTGNILQWTDGTNIYNPGDIIQYVTYDITLTEKLTKMSNWVEYDGSNNIINTYDTMAQAFSGVTEGNTLKLTNNYSDNSVPTANKNITIDLQGYVLTKINNKITISSGKTVTIKGSGTGGIIASNVIGITNYGTLIADNIIVTSRLNHALQNMAGGTLIVNSGTYTGGGSGSISTAAVANMGTVSISGGSFSTNYGPALSVHSECNATITGGKFEGPSTTEHAAIWNSGGNLTISGNTEISSSTYSTILNIKDKDTKVEPTLNLLDGEVICNAVSTKYAAVFIETGNATIGDNDTEPIINNIGGMAIAIRNNAEIKIKSGEITGGNDGDDENTTGAISNYGKLTMSGGAVQSNYGPGITTHEGYSATISGGTITGSTISKNAAISNWGKTTISGTKTNVSGSQWHTITNYAGATLSVTSGTVSNSNKGYAAIYNEGTATIGNTSSTSITTPDIGNTNYEGYGIEAKAGTVNIYSGFVHSGADAIRASGGNIRIGYSGNLATSYPKISSSKYAINFTIGGYSGGNCTAYWYGGYIYAPSTFSNQTSCLKLPSSYTYTSSSSGGNHFYLKKK